MTARRASFLNGILLVCMVVSKCVAAETVNETLYPEDVRGLIASRCLGCHDAAQASGGVDFSAINSDTTVLSQYRMWRKVMEQIAAGTMPPAGEQPLSDSERERLQGWFHTTFDSTARPDPGPPLIRQLTREEYSRTMRDLLRFWHDPAGEAGIPQETSVDQYANRAGGQVLENVLLERYFTAAELSLERLFTDPGTSGPRQALGVTGDLSVLAAEWEKESGGTSVASDAAVPGSAARRVLSRFMRRAFRRPVTNDEVERYAQITDAAFRQGDQFPLALRKALKPVLVSPHFLLRIERSTVASGEAVRISDHELAVRLSYFLWGTMPDDELSALADQGRLSQAEELERQVRRMLQHSKADAFTQDFLSRWLQLPQLHKALPSQNNFPTFTRSLRDAMERETRMFCDHLRKEDRSVLELLDSSYTFVNRELAEHYRMENPPMKDFQKVTLRPEDHRGGLLGMASILTLTSHTDRTKPTARGKWILDVLLGSPPPPPPANAGSFAPTDKDRPEPESFREKLALHASSPDCIACHKRIDPLGFALENYDAIGSWRDSLGDRPIDNLGTLPGVGEIRGVTGLRSVLLERRPQFIRNLIEQTLTFALGREVSYYDEPSIAEITLALQQDEYRFSRLIIEVVRSYPFQHRRSPAERDSITQGLLPTR